MQVLILAMINACVGKHPLFPVQYKRLMTINTNYMPNLNSPRLILTPIDNQFILSNIEVFIQALSALKFIGRELTSSENYRCFEIGDDFLHRITFLGCSPTLFSANNTDSDTFISIAQNQHVQFGHSSTIPPARCPHCRKTDKSWQQYFQRWNKNSGAEETCPNCNETFNFSDMKWKKNGGYGKLFIQIHGVQEQLAIPNQSFMDELQSITHTNWEYFFAE